MKERLVDADLPSQLLHIGADRDGTPGWVVALAFVIIGVAYSVVNHTQAMRMFASRNEWHLKMSVFAASVPLIIMTFCNLSIGVMGRALIPEHGDLPRARQDAIYPFLASQIDTIGLKGARRRRHSRVGQWLTPVIIFGSFAYVPLMLESGMLLFYLPQDAHLWAPGFERREGCQNGTRLKRVAVR